MSEQKWTPGSWERRADEDRQYVGVGPYCIVEETFATTEAKDHGATERKANADLIAAAPDLYEALEWAVSACECSIRERESGHRSECFAPAAKLALAKARGESEDTQ